MPVPRKYRIAQSCYPYHEWCWIFTELSAISTLCTAAKGTTGGPPRATVNTSSLDKDGRRGISTSSAAAAVMHPRWLTHRTLAPRPAGRAGPSIVPTVGTSHMNIYGYRSVPTRKTAAAVRLREGSGAAGGAASRLDGRALTLRERDAGSPPGDGERERGAQQRGSIPAPSSHPSSPSPTVTGHAVPLWRGGRRRADPAPRMAAVVAGGEREGVRPAGHRARWGASRRGANGSVMPGGVG